MEVGMTEPELERAEIETGIRSRLGLARVVVWSFITYAVIALLVCIYLVLRRHF